MLTKYGICKKKMFEGLRQPESARHPLLTARFFVNPSILWPFPEFIQIIAVHQPLNLFYSNTYISDNMISWSAPKFWQLLPLMKAIFLARSRAKRFLDLLKMWPNMDQLRSVAQLVTCADSNLLATSKRRGNLLLMCPCQNSQRKDAG